MCLARTTPERKTGASGEHPATEVCEPRSKLFRSQIQPLSLPPHRSRVDTSRDRREKLRRPFVLKPRNLPNIRSLELLRQFGEDVLPVDPPGRTPHSSRRFRHWSCNSTAGSADELRVLRFEPSEISFSRADLAGISGQVPQRRSSPWRLTGSDSLLSSIFRPSTGSTYAPPT